MSTTENSSGDEESYWDLVLEGGYAEVDGLNATTGLYRDGVLSTGEVRECLAVAVYDTEEELGYMLHLPPERGNPENTYVELADFMTQIWDRSDPEDLRAIVTGTIGLEDGSEDPTDPGDVRLEEMYSRGGSARVASGAVRKILRDADIEDRTHLTQPDFVEISNRSFAPLSPRDQRETYDWSYMD